MLKTLIVSTTCIFLLAFIPQKKSRVIFFGDSITAAAIKPGGFIAKIDSLSKVEKDDSYEFVGAGVSGNKIYDLYLRLEPDVLSKNPDVVVIFIGVNDVWHKRSSGTGTEADKFEKFYQAIIDKLKASSIRIILCTPAVIGEKTDNTNEQDGDMNNYSNIVRGLAMKNKLLLVDLRKIFLDYDLKNNPENKDRGILTADRVHLNTQGNLVVAEAMWKGIKAVKN